MVTTCKTCQTSFTASNKSHKYCRPECRNSYIARIDYSDLPSTSKTCPCCHVIFTVSISTANKKYCSSECRVKYIKDIQKEMRKEKLKEKIPCVTCGETFLYNPSIATRKFCNEKCRKKHYGSDAKHETTYCLYCNGFFKYDSKRASRKFCNERCRIKHHSKNKKDTSNEIIESRVRTIFERMRTTNGSFPFGIDISMTTLSSFTDNIKERILERDNNTCQVCEGSNVNLEIHHILKRRLGGTNEDSNLITLCVKCHRAIDTYDEEYAVKKCISNFNRSSIGHEEQVTIQQKVTSASFLLAEIFDKLSCQNIDHEHSELLVKIDELLFTLDD